MRITNTSELMLKYQKAKAKLVEYGVKQEDYPNFQLNSNDLSFSTIYIISNYVEAIIDDDSEKIELFSEQLKLVSEYYDASIKSRDRNYYNEDFLMIGISAYLLSNDFGSATVLCSMLDDCKRRCGSQYILMSIYKYILLNKPLEKSESDFEEQIISDLRKYYKCKDINIEILMQKLSHYRIDVYNKGNALDVFYVDILIAVVMSIVDNSSRRLLPKYSGISLSIWKNYLEKNTSAKVLWPAQQMMGKNGLFYGKNAIVQLPTGVGKTKSIELIIRSAFLSQRASKVIIVAPLRSLCNEITNDMIDAFGDDVKVNQFSDVLQEDYEILSDDLFESSMNEIIISTPEKLRFVLCHDDEILDSMDLFIFDEAHMFDDNVRGVSYEFLMMEIRKRLNNDNQLILLSAVLSNSNEIKEWLLGNDGIVASNSEIKSTPKSIGFSSKDKTTYYYSETPNEYDYYIPKSISVEPLTLLPRERKPRFFPELDNPTDVAIYHAIRLCKNGGVAIYVNTTRSVRSVLKKFICIEQRGYDISNIQQVTDSEESIKLQKLMKIYYGEDHEFYKCAKYGVFPHYSNLPNGIKLCIEYAIRNKLISCLVCTTTLAQGVNLPIKYLFLTSVRTSQVTMQARNFQNLIGRTARAGMYTEGSIIFTDTKLYDKKDDNKQGGNYKWSECFDLFEASNSEPCNSSILRLVGNINANYQQHLKGKNFVEYICDNYLFDNYMEKIEMEIKESATKKEIKLMNFFFSELALRKELLESLESWLIYAFIADDNFNDNYYEKARQLAVDTLAYHLATEEERKLLLSVFEIVTTKIIENLNETELKLATKTNLSVDMYVRINKWIEENELLSNAISEDDLIILICNFLYKIKDINISIEQFIEVVESWVNGKSFYYINGETNISIDILETLCNSKISYDMSFLIGNIIDVLCEKEDSDDIIEILTQLQKKIKYGVNSQSAISICEIIFNDRLISLKIVEILNDINIKKDKIKVIIDSNKEAIKKMLIDYPSYFMYKLNLM
ncbi:hypothetical protein DWW36_02100 [Erysipelotrichaceae bacterium AF15-26LB]|nr:DEAD/DEAH box helicase [[Clostridium] innocuum]RJV92370.1 hypothetical protein DWW36_02100 [Erysipelotrichaceae bacterium AF15-26LB]RJV92619.1 hypothetical protein DWX45_02545 [Erysipelotrichaceae bacterium AF19-24AC]